MEALGRKTHRFICFFESAGAQLFHAESTLLLVDCTRKSARNRPFPTPESRGYRWFQVGSDCTRDILTESEGFQTVISSCVLLLTLAGGTNLGIWGPSTGSESDGIVHSMSEMVSNTHASFELQVRRRKYTGLVYRALMQIYHAFKVVFS